MCVFSAESSSRVSRNGRRFLTIPSSPQGASIRFAIRPGLVRRPQKALLFQFNSHISKNKKHPPTLIYYKLAIKVDEMETVFVWRAHCKWVQSLKTSCFLFRKYYTTRRFDCFTSHQKYFSLSFQYTHLYMSYFYSFDGKSCQKYHSAYCTAASVFVLRVAGHHSCPSATGAVGTHRYLFVGPCEMICGRNLGETLLRGRVSWKLSRQ